MNTVLTIAGSDSCGGAGIQADIKTMTMNGVYAMSAITALTAQNTLGVKSILNSNADFLRDQIDCVFSDIFPDAVKVGMVSSVELIEVIADRLKFYEARNVVVDPVMVATSGASLIKDEAVDVLCTKIFPLADLITPNIPEAEVFVGKKISNETDMMDAARKIGSMFNVDVLIKGGHSLNDANDFLFSHKKNLSKWFMGKRIENRNTHGTGCTLSSAIAAGLAKGKNVEESIALAKDYISHCLEASLDLGKGSGPLMHNYLLNELS